MNQEALEKSLEKAGLTRNESVVYFTLLKTGTSKAGQILKEAGLNSGKIYEILESLKTKGLISESIINNVRHFTAAPPPQILEFIKKKKEELENNEKRMQSLIPELEKLRKAMPRLSKAVTYTGFKGLKTAVSEAFETLKPSEEILSMGITEKKEKAINEFWEIFTKRRIARKIPARHIFSERGGFFEKFKGLSFTQSKVMEAFTPVTVDVFGKDKVLIYNYSLNITCILIFDENTATSFTHFFNQLWKIAKV